MGTARSLRWLWLSLAIVAADRASKAAVETFTPEGYRRALVRNFVYLVHAQNPGIAFGIFSDSPPKWLLGLLVAGSGESHWKGENVYGLLMSRKPFAFFAPSKRSGRGVPNGSNV